MSTLVDKGNLCISKTRQGNESYYISTIEDCAAVVEHEDQSDVSDSINGPINFEFPTSRAELQPDKHNNTVEKTDFLVFLDIVGKLTEDIGGLQVKIDKSGSKNERLLIENCELRLDIASLQSKLETQSELMNPNQLPSAKAHPTEHTNHGDELQTAQLKKEILGLREKTLHLEKSKAAGNIFTVSSAKKNSNEMIAIEIEAKENLESQRRQCIVERREKYERHCIASKLFHTEGGGCIINGKSGQLTGGYEIHKVA